jgi:mycothiol synthase
MITIRPYEPPDFVEVYAVIGAAIKTDRTRQVNAEVLRSDLDEGIIEAALAVNEVQAIIGVATWELLDQGYFVQGWVHPDWRGQGAASALLRIVEDKLSSRLRKRVGCISRVYQDIPNVEALYRRQGYEEVRRFYNMSVNLKDRQFEAVVPPGIIFKAYDPSNLDALVEADNEFFADHWGSQPRSGREWKYQMIDSRPHDPALWVIAWENDTIVGECITHASLQGEANDGWIAIVGIKRQWRGHGLGRAVLTCGLQRLQQAGFETASLHADAENTPAVQLYRNLGMEIARTRIHFRKALIPSD